MLLGTLSDSHQENLTFMSNIPLLSQLRSHFTLSLLKDRAPSSFFKTWWVYYHIKEKDSQTEDSSWQTRFDRLSASSIISSSIVVSCSQEAPPPAPPLPLYKEVPSCLKGRTQIFREKYSRELISLSFLSK